jgi:hypothetical protein
MDIRCSPFAWSLVTAEVVQARFNGDHAVAVPRELSSAVLWFMTGVVAKVG